LDNVELVAGMSVLDIGCGCGASAIAAKLGGAKIVVANDIDEGMKKKSKLCAKKIGEAGDRTRGLSHAKRTLYH
jgi:predicted RNA methylase